LFGCMNNLISICVIVWIIKYGMNKMWFGGKVMVVYKILYFAISLIELFWLFFLAMYTHFVKSDSVNASMAPVALLYMWLFLSWWSCRVCQLGSVSSLKHFSSTGVWPGQPRPWPRAWQIFWHVAYRDFRFGPGVAAHNSLEHDA
jgi:hypothetical protein